MDAMIKASVRAAVSSIEEGDWDAHLQTLLAAIRSRESTITELGKERP